MTDDPTWLDATGQAALVAGGRITPSELVDGAIARIEKLNPTLNAVIHEVFDRARAAAARPLPDGPFRGVPMLFKDLGAELAGTPFSEGTAFAGDYHSVVDQELTKRFLAAGFVICGKTNTPEFGILPTTEPKRFGPTRNPWNIAHSTGGSSGAPLPRWPRAWSRWDMPTTGRVHSDSRFVLRAGGSQTNPGSRLDRSAVRRPHGWARRRARGDALGARFGGDP
jgi:hypothetical protein